MTPAETSNLLAFVGSAYPSMTVTPGLVETWSLALADLPYETAKKAVFVHLRSSKWPPTIADIATISAEYAARVPDPETVLRDILASAHRSSVMPLTLHPLTLAVVGAIGWSQIIDSENPEALRAHILRVATTYRRRALEAANLSSAGLELPAECEPVGHLVEPRKIAGLLSEFLREPGVEG